LVLSGIFVVTLRAMHKARHKDTQGRS